MSEMYILKEDGKTPVPCEDVLEWGRWMQKAERHVAFDKEVGPQKLTVSTVFLGLDHNFGPYGPPILFETMVFPPDSASDLYCDRYYSWHEAERGHSDAVLKVLSGEIKLESRDETTEPPLDSQ